MILSPTRKQRERILDNIIIPGSTAQGQDNSTPHPSGAPRFNDDTDAMYRLSPYAFLIERKSYCALYHSLNLKKVFGDDRLAKFFRMGSTRQSHRLEDFEELLKGGDNESKAGDIRILVDDGFLIREECDSSVLLSKLKTTHNFKSPHINLLYLLLTNNCNLKCTYCTIESVERKPSHFNHSFMSKEMARRGIDLFLKTLHEDATRATIVYYGGEPLLNWEVQLDSLVHIRELENRDCFNGRKVDVYMVCNGTLITEEIAMDMRRLHLSAGISLDGLRHHHDRMRLFRQGGGSWKECLGGYFKLKRVKGNCGISCTLGPHNYMDIEEIVEFFATRLECRSLGFNILKGLSPGNTLEIPPDTITEQLIKAYRINRRYGIYEDRIMRKIKAFVNEEPWVYDCGGYGGQIALCADGIVGPCHIAADDRRFCWGHIENEGMKELILEGELTTQWCHRSPLEMRACADCIGLGICGGGCAEEAYIKRGDIYALDENFCVHCTMMIDWMFDDLAEKLKQSGEL